MSYNPFATFIFGVRTPRIACFINENSADWQRASLKTIEIFSTTWGGSHFIIVPTDGKSISLPFWSILLSYDPDYLWTYTEGEEYFELDDKLLQELKLRLAPFHFQDYVIENYVYENFSPDFPYTNLLTILPNCNNPNNITEPINLEGIMRLWVSSEFGQLTDSYREKLKGIGFNFLLTDYSERSIELFESVVTRNPLIPENTLVPYQLSATQLSSYRNVKFNYHTEATIIIVGESLQDFCLYYSLSRMRNKVAWFLPSWITDEEKDINFWFSNRNFAHFMRALNNMPKKRDSSIYFLSLSMNEEQIAVIRNLINESPYNLDVQEGFLQDSKNPPSEELPHEDKLRSSIDFLLRYPLRLYENGNINKSATYQLNNNETAAMVETPKPKNFSYLPPYDHRWITEFSVTNYHAPRHPELGNDIVRGITMLSKEGRTTKNGIAYFCPTSSYFGGDIDQVLVRPKIYLPRAFDIFNKLFNKLGYSVQISDKGRFSLDVILKFGSLSSLANFLIADNKRQVLEKFRDESRYSPEIIDQGIFLQSDRRRYLDFVAIEKIAGSRQETANLIDDLIAKSVLHRGLILKCEFCRSTDWFGIAELSKEFTCKRCNRTQVYRQFNFLSKAEPVWYYKLDEIVFKALVNDFIVPILTLYRLQRNSEVFDFAPELELQDKYGKKVEIDICCVADGQIIIGEAKKSNRLADVRKQETNIVNKYLNLTEKLGASKVLFSTYADTWRAETFQIISGSFSNSLTDIIFWSRNDLVTKR